MELTAPGRAFDAVPALTPKLPGKVHFCTCANVCLCSISIVCFIAAYVAAACCTEDAMVATWQQCCARVDCACVQSDIVQRQRRAARTGRRATGTDSKFFERAKHIDVMCYQSVYLVRIDEQRIGIVKHASPVSATGNSLFLRH
jgi:uncharacterized protein YmfQ (DUF2313 family)